MDSPTSDLAAKCSTPSKPAPSKPAASTSPIASSMPASTNRAPSGTASACPVDRSSSTTTSCPDSTSLAAHTLPTYPAPPVTSNFTAIPPSAGSLVAPGARRGHRRECPGRGPAALRERREHPLHHVVVPFHGYQRDGRPAEAAADHPGAQRTRRLRRVHRDVKLRRGHL